MRQFILENQNIKNGLVTLEGKDFRYLRQVLRVKTGDMLSVRLKDGKLQNSTVAKIDDKGRKITIQFCANSENSEAVEKSITRGVQSTEIDGKLPAVEYWLFQFLPKPQKFEQIVSLREKNYSWLHGDDKRLESENQMLKLYRGGNGVKTGYTQAAGRCLISGAKRGNIQLVAVVLDSLFMWQDSVALLDYGFANVKPLPTKKVEVVPEPAPEKVVESDNKQKSFFRMVLNWLKKFFGFQTD